MTELSAVIIDTYPNKGLAARAVHMALRMPNIKKIYTFSDEPFIEGAVFVKISPIKSNNEYGAVIFDMLPEYINEEYFFIIQWDGFPLFPNNWSPDFLNYDYIGAPLGDLGNWVGNGGFSLRSKKLINVCRDLKIGIDRKNPRDQPEDQIICLENRILLESNGMKFAPLDVAKKFSYQVGILDHEILGFHSPEHLPLFIPEAELIPIADQIIERISQPIIMLRFLGSCMKVNSYALFRVSVLNYKSKPNLIKAIEFEMAANSNSTLLSLIEQINA
jgi:Protein of unknown function (DUF5672)